MLLSTFINKLEKETFIECYVSNKQSIMWDFLQKKIDHMPKKVQLQNQTFSRHSIFLLVSVAKTFSIEKSLFSVHSEHQTNPKRPGNHKMWVGSVPPLNSVSFVSNNIFNQLIFQKKISN